MNDDETFVARWSRRKRAAKPTKQREEQAEKSPDRSDSPTAGTQRIAPTPSETPPQSPAAGAHEPAFDIEKLPALESITAATDIRAFLAAGVPPELTRAALRRAWAADPKIRDFVGLAEYAWDFNAPDSMPGFGSLEMTDELRREVEKLVGRNLAPAEGQDPHAPKKSPEEPAQTENPIESAAAERLSTHCELPADSHIETSAPAREDEPHPSASFCSTTEVSVAVQHQLEKAVEVNVIAKKRHGRALPE